MPTLADVAKIAGVGVMSVSRVVNGTRRVSPEVERRVRVAIKKIGYQPNEAARVLKGMKSTVLGIIVPDLVNTFYSTCCNAIQEAAAEAGYVTLIAASGHREDIERRETEMMVQRRIAGLVVVPTGSQNDHFAAAQRSNIPVVAIDRPLQRVNCASVTVDNFAASAHATEHLIQHGHKNVLYITDDEVVHTRIERMSGYTDAMRRAKLVPRVCLVGSVAGSAQDQLSFAFDSANAPTAIFAGSNYVCTDVLKFLQHHRIRMPDQVALASFDDFSAATLVSPTVTVIRQPVAELGRQAARILLDQLDNPKTAATSCVKKELPTEFLVRESCGCLPAD
jgi:LacI family transcriptional regulator